jgi:demethylmenaquinone methyltransferase/2-methoxy-6-polyprenyl-1,4-benzoquinol methylase
MFGRIVPRYDLVNRVLSMGQDARWRRRVAERVAAADPRWVLDVCTGTGDLALAGGPRATQCATDFSLPMLEVAAAKARGHGRQLGLFASDALRLPVPDDHLDVVTVAFGVRNFEALEDGLRELLRVLRRGGTLLVLELSVPRDGPLAPVLGCWLRRVPSIVGGLLSGDREAYGYLTESILGFPGPGEFCVVLEGVGAMPVAVERLTGGAATLYEAIKAS